MNKFKNVLNFSKNFINSADEYCNVFVLIILSVYIFYLDLLNTALSSAFNNNQLSFLLTLFYIFDAFKITKAIFKKDYKSLIFFIITFVILFFAYKTGTYQFLLLLATVIIALYDVEYEKIIRVYLLTTLVLLLLIVFASQTGLTFDFIYLGDGKIESSLGMGYTTDFATLILFFSAYLFATNKKCSNWLTLIPAFISLFIAKYITLSRTSTICSILLIVIIVLFNIVKNEKIICFLKKYIFPYTKYAFLLFSILAFALLILYEKGLPIGQTLDSLLSGRLRLTDQSIKNNGIHAFGSYFEQYGAGGGGVDTYRYNFLDISYFLIFIRYGWMTYILFAFLFFICVKKMLNNGQYKLIVVFLLICFHSMSEHHLSELNFNILLVMPFANFGTKGYEYSKKEIKINSIVYPCVIILVLISAYTLLPSCLTYLRTLFEVKGLLYLNDENRRLIIPLLLALIIFILIIVSTLSKTIVSIINRQKINYKHAYAYSICLISFLLIGQCKDFIFDDRYVAYHEMFSKEETAINLIKENKTGSLYSINVPAYYEEYFGGFDDSLYYRNELARLKNVTVVADIGWDSHVFSYMGFNLIQISDSNFVYTNDEAVIEAFDGFTFEQ